MPIYMKLQVNYDELESIANLLSAEAEELEQMMARLAQGLNFLEGGAWEGQAANAFYGEMRDVVMPGMRTLATRLEDVHSLMQHLNRHFQDAEQQVGNLFKQNSGLKFGGNNALNFSDVAGMKFDSSLKIDGVNNLKLGGAGDKWHDAASGDILKFEQQGGYSKFPNADAGKFTGDGLKFGGNNANLGDGSVHKWGDGSIKMGSTDYMKFESGGGGGAGDSGLKIHPGGVNITDGASAKINFTGGVKPGADANVKFESGGGGGAGDSAAKFEGDEFTGGV